MTIDLIEKRKDRLKYFKKNHLIGYFLFFIIVFCFLTPFHDEKNSISILKYSVIIFLTFILLSFYLKRNLYNNYIIIGTIKLSKTMIEIQSESKSILYNLSESETILYYGFWRNHALGPGSDFLDGFNVFSINGNRYNFLLKSEEQAEQLKELLKHYYSNNLNSQSISILKITFGLLN